MTGCTSGGYDQFETSPKAIEQELRPVVCERRQTDENKIENERERYIGRYRKGGLERERGGGREGGMKGVW